MCMLNHLLLALGHSESGSFSVSQPVDAVSSTVVSANRARNGKMLTLSLCKVRSMALAVQFLYLYVLTACWRFRFSGQSEARLTTRPSRDHSESEVFQMFLFPQKSPKVMPSSCPHPLDNDIAASYKNITSDMQSSQLEKALPSCMIQHDVVFAVARRSGCQSVSLARPGTRTQAQIVSCGRLSLSCLALAIQAWSCMMQSFRQRHLCSGHTDAQWRAIWQEHAPWSKFQRQ